MAVGQASFAKAEERHAAIDDQPEPNRFAPLSDGLKGLDQRLGQPWSARFLRASLGLALVFCWIAYFLGWGLGASGRVGDIGVLANPGQPARLVGAISAILFPLVAMLIGRTFGRLERWAKLKLVRWWRRKPKQYRTRLRVHDFERRYRWLLGLAFGAALITVLIWYRRGDVAAFAIVFSWLALGPVSGIAMARRFSSPTSQGLAGLIAGFGSISGAVLLILAFAGAGVSAFAFAILGITNVAFTGAIGVLLDIIMGGVFTFGLALAGAGVATVALALAGAGTGIATLTGVATMSRAGLAAFVILMSGAAVATLAFKEAAALSAAIGGISALAVAAAVSHNRMGRHGAYAGAIGAIALLTVSAVLFGWGAKPLVMFAVCFFFLLPSLTGLTFWAAFGTMRTLVGRSVARGRGWLVLALAVGACWLIGALFAAMLAFLLGYGSESYNQLTLARSDVITFEIEPMIRRAVADPFGEGFWPSLMILMPIMLPVIFTANLLTAALLTLQPNDYRLRRLLFRAVGLMLAFALLLGVIGFVTTSEDVEIAPLFGDIARNGLDTARPPLAPPSKVTARPRRPLLDGDGFREVSGLIDVGAFDHCGMVGEELDRKGVEKRGNEGIHVRKLDSGVDVIRELLAAMSVAEQDHLATACDHLLQIARRLFEQMIRRGHDDHRHILVDQRDWPVLQLTSGIALGMNVADFLQFQSPFERDRKGGAAAEIKDVARRADLVRDFFVLKILHQDFRRARRHLVEGLGQHGLTFGR